MSPGDPQTTPHDFLEVFSVTDASGQPALVAGGHAVNLWALYYMPQESELSSLGPFVSKDLDFLADQETVFQLSRILGQQPIRPPKGDPNPVLARFDITTDRGTKTSIEVLFALYGANPVTMKKRAVIVESPQLGARIRLPDPASLLETKIQSALGLDQQRRQDLKHVRILVFCNRAFLRETLKTTEKGELAERNLINGLESLFRVVQSEPARQAALRFGIDWSSAFPVTELLQSPMQRVQNFMQLRFRPAFPHLGSST